MERQRIDGKDAAKLLSTNNWSAKANDKSDQRMQTGETKSRKQAENPKEEKLSCLGNHSDTQYRYNKKGKC
jgi:predicted nuclease of restriction endonuclease-like RecB superfamily